MKIESERETEYLEVIRRTWNKKSAKNLRKQEETKKKILKTETSSKIARKREGEREREKKPPEKRKAWRYR